MNPRIKELALQAGFQYIQDEGIGWAGNYNSSLPKLAELIVAECIDCLKPLSRNHSMVGAAQDTIREHFGGENERTNS
jgi:hypothetical protein